MYFPQNKAKNGIQFWQDYGENRIIVVKLQRFVREDQKGMTEHAFLRNKGFIKWGGQLVKLEGHELPASLLRPTSS